MVANVRNAKADVLSAKAVGLTDTSGNLLNEANNGLYFAYSAGGKQLFGMAADPDKSNQYQEAYYKNAPAPTALWEKLLVYLKFQKDTAKAFREISNLPLDSNATEADYSTAVSYATRLKNKPLADLLTSVVHQKFPAGDWKVRDYYAKMSATKDVEGKEKLYAEFLKEFPGQSPTKPGTYSNAIRATVFNAVANTGDINKAQQYGTPHATGTTLASENNTLAWQAALKGQDLAEATALSKASLDTLMAVEATDRERPSYFTPAQWKKNLEYNYGMDADTYAYLLEKQGDTTQAFKYETIAVHAMGDDVETSMLSRYYQMMAKEQKPSKVFSLVETSISNGKSDSTMETLYKRLYKGPGSADDALTALNTKAKSNKEAEMVRSILHDPASHFTLTDLQGDKVSLDSLKGKTVVLDFWATWCGPCKASFPAMQQLVTKYKDDKNVVFLFVDTWEHSTDAKQTQKDVADFIRTNAYTFHVVLDNDSKVVEQYKVEGIPTKFVIDGNGILRFKAVGYNDNLSATVEEVGEMIELTKKS
jgi:thiol-disulfide isomerase/thioredoxin